MRPSCGPGSVEHLAYSVHLARRHPHKTAAALALIAAASLGAVYAFGSPILGLLAGVLLLAAVSDYLFRLRFRLTEQGVEMRGLLSRRRMQWLDVRSVRCDELGVKLSALARRSRLEAYRGIYVYFEGNASEVMSFIADHVKAEAAGGVDHPSV